MLDKDVLNYLQSHRNEHLSALKELLAIPSLANIDDGNCEKCADWLVKYLGKAGMKAQVLPTGPYGGLRSGKPCVVAKYNACDSLPTVLIYGHYDVQPPDPLDLWHTKPFEATVRGENLYARGANDDKGQLFTHIMAIEAWMKTHGRLPVNVTLLLEGEEEIGSPTIEQFIKKHKDLLSADAVVISDSEFFAPGVPSITYALRGIAYFELKVTGAKADCHSGLHGGAVANPINALAKIIAAMHDENGRVTIPGFYDDVLPATDAELKAWAALPFDEKAYAARHGVAALAGGERDRSIFERLWSRPTLDCNGINGGYTGKGVKTVIPSEAYTKITMRLVPHQKPEKIAAGLKQFIAEHTPAGVSVGVTIGQSASAVLLKTDTPEMQAARKAVREAFGSEVAMIRCGASIPITEVIQRLMGLDAVLMGFGLPDDNLHAPNEKFSLQQLWKGSHAAAAFLQAMADKQAPAQNDALTYP